MDLGAPILDVIAAEESIVSDGTVSASGYDPIVITKTKTSEIRARTPGVFNPNLPNYQDEFAAQNVTVKKEIEEKIIEEKVYIRKADDQSTSWLIICGSIILLAIVVTGLIVRWFLTQAKKDLIAAEMRKKGKEDLDHQIEMDAHKKDFEELPQETCMTQTNTKLNNVDQYEQQYDPNNDFAIFNVGNQAVGGLMTIKEKMNLADNVNKNQQESSEEEEVQIDKDKVTSGPHSEPRSTLTNSTTSLPEILNKKGGKVPLTLDNVEALGLPEDQEIQEQDEEEEEEDV